MDLRINEIKGRGDAGKNMTNGRVASDLLYNQINERLEAITRFLNEEVDNKRTTIEEQHQEIERLKNELHLRTNDITLLQQQLQQSTHNTEGHRQLINKLLSDISQYQNDIDWYKRTYERRSIWGVLKEKLTKSKS